MKDFVRIIIFVITIVNTFDSRSETFQQLSNWEGQYQCAIYSFYQDESGIIWIGTNRGLKRYNGNSVEDVDLFAQIGQYTRQVVTHICGNHAGSLYLKVDHFILQYHIADRSSKVIWKGTDPVTIEYAKKQEGLLIGIKNDIYLYHSGRMQYYAGLSDSTSYISTLLESSAATIYAGTESGKVYLLDTLRKEKELLAKNSRITCLFESADNNIWIGSWSHGVSRFDPVSEAVLNLTTQGNTKLASDFVRAFCEDNDHNIWISTINGLNRISPAVDQITHFGTYHGLMHNSIWALSKDLQGGIWIGTFYGGAYYFHANSNLFSLITFESDHDKGYPTISKAVVDKRNHLWMCTEGRGLLFYDHSTGKYEFYSLLGYNTLKTLFYDEQKDQLWIGTYQQGLFLFDIATKHITHFQAKNHRIAPEEEEIYSIIPYGKFLLLGTRADIYKFDTSTGEYTKEVTLNRRMHSGSVLLIEGESLIIAGNGLFTYNFKTKELTDHSIGRETSDISAIFRDSRKRLWIGTRNHGLALWNQEEDMIHFFGQKEINLRTLFINNITESASGNLLVSTDKGFSIIDKDILFSRNYSTLNGFPLLSMRNGSILNMNDGNILLSGLNGIVFVQENKLLSPDNTPDLVPDRLWINNREVIPDDSTKILQRSLRYTDRIALNHRQNVITIELTPGKYATNKHLQYQYKLKEFDQEWIDLNRSHRVQYMNLPVGTYQLSVRIQDNPETETTVLSIRKNAAFYASWYAYTLYFIVFLALAIWIFISSRARLSLKMTLEQQKIANRSKFDFFTNITHEFRTPVTLILGKLEQMMESDISRNLKKAIASIHQNALQMQDLTTEFLDFRKLEEGQQKLQLSRQNIIDTVYKIYESFLDYTIYKEIDLRLDIPSYPVLVSYDPIQIRKALNNLLSNAVKNTNKGGEILISLTTAEDSILIGVKDNGIGIAPHMQERIFTPFYQANNKQDFQKEHTGTGIGLALSKGIVELHQGTIWLESESGKGASFYIKLPKGKTHRNESRRKELVEDSFADSGRRNQSAIIETSYSEPETSPSQQAHILVVEDNAEMRQMIIKMLHPIYRVSAAENGEEGLRMALEKHPDLIVSDVMMPRMSGIAMCARLKQDFRTCHIPVILLSVKADEENNITGLQSGADDYVAKPFNRKVLVAKCNSMIANRKLLQETFSKQIGSEPQTVATNAKDQEFIQRVIDIIEKDLSNPKLNVAYLSREMAMSRTIFTAKMKGVTGKNPSDFILNLKLKKGAWLLQNEPEKPVAEISDMVGFGSSKYFAKCFKDLFGVIPSSFRTGKSTED